MRNRKKIVTVFSILLITTLFSKNNTFLWDFGVIIEDSGQKIIRVKDNYNLSNSRIDSYPQVQAQFSNSFVPPTEISPFKTQTNKEVSINIFDEINPENIYEVELLTGKLTLQNNYQSIIDILEKFDFSNLDENENVKLNYWFANAFFNIGEYKKSENIINEISRHLLDDQTCFLLAMIYEKKGEIIKAQREYWKFIDQFPDSDYKVTALIKARMLDRVK